MDIAQSKHLPVIEQPTSCDVQASENWFKIIDMFLALHNCFYLISLHLSDNGIISQKKNAFMNQFNQDKEFNLK